MINPRGRKRRAMRRPRRRRTHSVRKANVAVGMVRAAAVDLVRIAGLLHHHRAGLHRFWSVGPHTHTHTLLVHAKKQYKHR